jgi:putative OPT family oligopeptide transporter
MKRAAPASGLQASHTEPGGSPPPEAELTAKAILAGVVMALIFGAANAYLGMKAGQTVSATIPAAVIGIALFRLPFYRGSILEQNIARTAASVGEALAAGAIFTIPAFLLVNLGGQVLWKDLRSHFWEASFILMAGGLIGVMFIIILRRPLCVDSDLPFPESTASAEIVRAGQAGGDTPRYIFGAMGLGALLQLLKSDKGLLVFKESISGFWPFARGGFPYTTPAASPALIGIGYIIGPRLAFINTAGGLIAWWLLIPLVIFLDPALPMKLGGGSPAPWDVVADSIWRTTVRPIAVGTMLVGAVYTLYEMRQPMIRSLRGAFEASTRAGSGNSSDRTDIDIPLPWVFLSTVALVIPITLIYYHFTGRVGAAIAAAVVMTITGFVLSAVGGYLVGLVGGSNQPVSGLTLAALVVSALVMIAMGVKGAMGVAAVLGVASVVCNACCVSGSLIQDLKAGYLLRGTPWKMELVEIIAVIVVSLFLMLPIIALHAANIQSGGTGIGDRELPAPQAGLMAQLATGIVGGQMPWALVAMGIAFGVGLVMMQAPSPMLIAVGMYLPFETVSAILVGGVMKWISDVITPPQRRAAVEEKGTLVASGLIAGEAIAGILLPVLFLSGIRSVTHLLTGADELSIYTRLGGYLSLAAFATVAYALIVIPRRASRAPANPAPGM